MRRATIGLFLFFAVLWGFKEWIDGLRMLGTHFSTAQEFVEGPRRQVASLASTGLVEPQQFQAKEEVWNFGFAPRAEEAAAKFVEERKVRWGVQPYHELRPEYYKNPLGTSVKYHVYQDGKLIQGMDIEIEVGPDGEARERENGYRPVSKVELQQPRLSSLDALALVKDRYRLDEKSTAGISEYLFLAPGSDEPEIVYAIPVKDVLSGEGPGEQIVLRASDGQIVSREVPRVEFPH